jgi:carbamate kinase
LKLIVLAVGGNSLIRDGNHRATRDQWALARETCRHIAEIIQAGHRVVVTHGNGPQVGFGMRRAELARHELDEVPLDSLDADSQGNIGYMLQQSLQNEFVRRGLDKLAVAVVTQVEVAGDDPAFDSPAKPVGFFMDAVTARARAERDGWTVREDSGRGWRRVVPSPEPVSIVELGAIRTLVDSGFVVTAVGGGGIPVVRNMFGELQGVEAVIDKDAASSLLAIRLGADELVISTSVEQVFLDFGKATERPLERATVADIRRYLAGGHFAEGSMAPKMRAVMRFLEHGGRRAVITCPEQLERAVEGEAGTEILP